MEVSFKGISNLYMAKRNYSRFGSYLANNGTIKKGDKNYTDILIRCQLLDDHCGNDFSDFIRALAKCSPHYKNNCINPQKSNQLELSLTHFNVKDGAGCENSTFKINDCDILLNSQETLPIFTFMAKLTRTIAFAIGPSDNQKALAKFFNAAVHNEAVHFIEDLMPLKR